MITVIGMPDGRSDMTLSLLFTTFNIHYHHCHNQKLMTGWDVDGRSDMNLSPSYKPLLLPLTSFLFATPSKHQITL